MNKQRAKRRKGQKSLHSLEALAKQSQALRIQVLRPTHEPPKDRQVLDCASPLALWLQPGGRIEKRQRTGAVQDARACGRRFMVPMRGPKTVEAPHEPRSSGRESAHPFGQGTQSRLTSAATVQGFKARISSGNSHPGPLPLGEGATSVGPACRSGDPDSGRRWLRLSLSQRERARVRENAPWHSSSAGGFPSGSSFLLLRCERQRP